MTSHIRIFSTLLIILLTLLNTSGVLQAADTSTTIITDISYGPSGQISEIVFGNGAITTFTYDINQLYRLVNKKTVHNKVILQNIAYTYDPVGNIISMVDTGIGTPKQAAYTYDELDRLTQATITDINTGETITETYTYSPVGNILYASGVGNYEYNNQKHPYAVTKAGDTTYTYDASGNLTSSAKNNQTTTYTYDYQNRLTRITDYDGNFTRYTYGHDNQRLQKILPDGKTITYIGNLAEVDSNGDFTLYLFVESLRVATQDKSGLYYHINDHLNSANLLLNQEGQIVQRVDYLPFGAERLNETTTTFQTRHTYTDQEKDPESNLLYYGARYYDPNIGRFTQPDPVVVETTRPEFQQAKENPQLLNPYSYVANNPIKYVDPTGESTWKAWLLHPVRTLTHTTFWQGVSNLYLRKIKSDRITADLLEHSLTINPPDIVATEKNSYSYIVDETKASQEYLNFVNQQIKRAEEEGQRSINELFDNSSKERQSIQFNKGDLSTSIHGTHSTWLTGYKTKDGIWHLQTSLHDVYDYKSQQISYDKDLPKKAGNEAAVRSQKQEVISNFNIDIYFNDVQ